MSKLYIFDKYDNLLTTLSNESEETCPFWDAPFDEELNKGESFEFTIPGNHEDAIHVVPGNQVAFKDRDGEFRLFWIRELDEAYEEAIEKRWICEPWYSENNNEPIEDIRAYETTAKDALTRVLQGTRSQPGIVADLGVNTANFYFISVNKSIEKIINTWGGEFRGRITIDFENSRISGRYIDILPRRGADTGKRWVAGKDIIKHRRTILHYPITALYGRGKGLESGDGYSRRITFEDVEWKVANGDPVDKPLGQKWVGDPESLAKYGIPNTDGTLRHVFDFVDDSEEEDPASLLKSTWEDLQRRNKPIEQYDLSVILLEKISGYEHEKVRLGDTTYAINRKFKPEIATEQRVVKFKYYVDDPSDERAEVTLGDIIPMFEEDRKLEEIEAKLNERTGIWDDKGGISEVTDDVFPDTIPAVPSLRAEGLFSKVLLEWDADFSSYMKHYEIYASTVAGFTPDASNLVAKVLTDIFSFEGEPNKQYYFRVRGINKHGNAGGFSNEMAAITVRLIPNDFEPSRIPEFIDIGIIKQASQPAGTNYIEGQLWIQERSGLPAIWHRWDADLQAWEKLGITTPDEIGAVNESTYNTDLQNVMNDISDKADAEWVNGQLVLKANADDVYSKTTTDSLLGNKADKSTTYTKTEVNNALDGKVSTTTYTTDMQGVITDLENHESRISQTETDITSKVSTDTFNALEGRVDTAESTLTQHATAISSKVESSTFNALEGRVDTAETTISQHATQISLRVTTSTYEADITDPTNGLKARMTTAESSITQNASNIDLKVSKNGVIGSINVTPETVKINVAKVEINGDLSIVNGLLTVKDASITRAKIQNLAIDNTKIADGTITNAKIANATITNAKIKDIDASKITTGILKAIDIEGVRIESSKYVSVKNDNRTVIDGESIRVQDANPQFDPNSTGIVDTAYIDQDSIGLTRLYSVEFNEDGDYYTGMLLSSMRVSSTDIYSESRQEGNFELRLDKFRMYRMNPDFLKLHSEYSIKIIPEGESLYIDETTPPEIFEKPTALIDSDLAEQVYRSDIGFKFENHVDLSGFGIKGLRDIYSYYTPTIVTFHEYSNGNVVHNAVNGNLYLGYTNTSSVYSNADFGMMNGHKILPESAGNLTLLNGTTNYFGIAKYTKSSDGVVTVTAMVRPPALNSNIAQLPSGCRPVGGTCLVAGMTNSGACRLDVTVDGYIIQRDGGTGWVAFNFTFDTYSY